ncbi:MAG: CsbD family protein, partial [Proteobacteria bacterium]
MDTDRFVGAAKDVAGKFEETVCSITNDEATRSSGVSRQMEGKSQNLYGQAKDGFSEAGERAEKAVRASGDLAEQLVDEGVRYSKDAAKRAEGRVIEKPIASLLLATTVGFI